MNKDGTGNAWDGLKNIGMALVYFLLLFFTGEHFGHWWAMILVGGLGGAALGYFAGKDLKAVVAWGGIGAVAGFLFYLAL